LLVSGLGAGGARGLAGGDSKGRVEGGMIQYKLALPTLLLVPMLWSISCWEGALYCGCAAPPLMCANIAFACLLFVAAPPMAGDAGVSGCRSVVLCCVIELLRVLRGCRHAVACGAVLVCLHRPARGCDTCHAVAHTAVCV